MITGTKTTAPGANLRHNIIANVSGKLWSVLLSLAVVPIYLRALGIEAYGLIGILVTLMGILVLFDLGLGTALSRELARYTAMPGDPVEIRNLLRTVESIYWLIGISIGVVLVIAAPALTEHWIKPRTLNRETVEQSLTLIGIAIACMWPRSLYSNGLAGMQRQVALNALSATIITLQTIGGVIVVWQIHTIQALIAWYAFVGLLESALSGVLLWRALPWAAEATRVEIKQLSHISRFASSMAAISVLSILLTQLDKVILSSVLTLDAFAYYMLGWRVAGGLYYLITPITSTFFPRFSQLALQQDQIELTRIYHRSCQLLSVLVLPAAAVIALFSYEFLFLWTQDKSVALNTHVVLSLLMVATALNGLMGLPLMLQLAHGSTRVIIVVNAIAVVILAPMIYVASLHYGATGAASIWLTLNCGYVLILLRLMHRHILPKELRAWFVIDVGAPLAAALGAALFWRLIVPSGESYSIMLIQLGGASVLALAAATLAAPHMRDIVLGGISRMIRRQT